MSERTLDDRMVGPSGHPLLLARIRAASDESDKPTLTPLNPSALAAGLGLDEVQFIWMIHLNDSGVLCIDEITHIRYWNLVEKLGTETLTALLCSSGQMYVVSDDSVYRVDDVSSAWIRDRRPISTES